MSSNYSKHELSKIIKAKALELGFSACGIAKSEAVDTDDQTFFKDWITHKYHAQMSYLENYYDKRMDPTLLVPGSKSIISVALNYYPKEQIPPEEYQIAWYAYGKDYHEILKARLEVLFNTINELTPIQGRFFTDTAPILERYWAWKAGLGWIGKNTQLIIPKAGSTFFLGELIIDLDLEYDTPMPNRCGSCTKCIKACPTQALIAPHTLDSNRCISYLTIENRGDISQEFHKEIGPRIYGCDECIKACPWHRFATPTTVVDFALKEELRNMKKVDWHNLTTLKYQSLFYKSAIKRAKLSGIQRNIGIAKLNDSEATILP